jgi:hypothetical protein
MCARTNRKTLKLKEVILQLESTKATDIVLGSTQPAFVGVNLGGFYQKRRCEKEKSNQAIINPISSIYKFSIAARFNFANLGIRQQKLLKVGVRQEMMCVCVYVSNNNDRIAE